MLLEDIYYPVSAVISVGGHEEILDIHLFDTAFGGTCMRVAPDAAQLWLMSNHPDGCPALYETDARNLQRLKGLASGRRVRMFLASEEFACREMDVPDACEEGKDDHEEDIDSGHAAAVPDADERCG